MSKGCPITSEKEIYLGSITKFSEGDWIPVIYVDKSLLLVLVDSIMAGVLRSNAAMKVALSTEPVEPHMD